MSKNNNSSIRVGFLPVRGEIAAGTVSGGKWVGKKHDVTLDALCASCEYIMRTRQPFCLGRFVLTVEYMSPSSAINGSSISNWAMYFFESWPNVNISFSTKQFIEFLEELFSYRGGRKCFEKNGSTIVLRSCGYDPYKKIINLIYNNVNIRSVFNVEYDSDNDKLILTLLNNKK